MRMPKLACRIGPVRSRPLRPSRYGGSSSQTHVTGTVRRGQAEPLPAGAELVHSDFSRFRRPVQHRQKATGELDPASPGAFAPVWRPLTYHCLRRYGVTTRVADYVPWRLPTEGMRRQQCWVANSVCTAHREGVQGVLAPHTARLIAAGILTIARQNNVAIRMGNQLSRAVAHNPRQFRKSSQCNKTL